ncbi:DinB family protein [Paenibacillus sp. MBLB4367]|uniref:DinB family protein n=1 Tax=Paenibacillus sp. MBLB4367 TaxID=3384767 RepID=UPI003907EC7A
MFLKISDFVQNWHHEAGSTQKIFDALTDESLSQEVSPQDRTLGRIAWHLVTTLHEMMSRTGLRFEAPEDDADVPASAKTIADSYRQTSAAMIAAIESQWTDASLLEQSNLYGESWPNGLTLSILVSHQIHHRGQITVLMRQAGLKVPGVYGPAREEWSLMGAEPPKV